MIKNLFFISFFIFFFQSIFAYNYEYKSDDVSISLKFDESKISEIKFESNDLLHLYAFAGREGAVASGS